MHPDEMALLFDEAERHRRRRTFVLERAEEYRIRRRTAASDADLEYMDDRIDELVAELSDVLDRSIRAERDARLLSIAIEARDGYAYNSPLTKAADVCVRRLELSVVEAEREANEMTASAAGSLAELRLWVLERARIRR